jgi:hypothetical protein
MSKIKFAALGVAALGVAALPVAASYAAEVTNPQTADTTYQATIEDTFTFTNSQEGQTITSPLTNGGDVVTNATLTNLKVVTNHSKGFNITAKSEANSSAALKSATDTIPYSTTALTQGTSGWNLTLEGAFSTSGIIALADDGVTIHTQDTPTTTAGVDADITYAAAAASNQAAGTYDNVVTYTATLKS